METSKEPVVNANLDNYKFDGTTYYYTDKESNFTYAWNIEKNEWEPKNDAVKSDVEPKEMAKKSDSGSKNDNEEENDSDDNCEDVKPEAVRQDLTKGHYSYEGDTHIYTDPNDGTVYFWDKEKKAWFPKIDDTFIAYYQMSYGFTAPDSAPKDEAPSNQNEPVASKVNQNPPEVPENNLKRKAEPEPAKWFNLDDEHNTKVYVSNLPLDITEVEFVDLMQKCGLVMKDLESGKMKIKLYTDPATKTLKGDALCTYIKKESVDLALKLLDDYEFRGKKIKVEKAHFTMKGNAYDPSLKPKKKRRKDKEKLKKMQEKLFAWQPDKLRGERAKHECVVVIKNLFDPSMFDENLGLIIEYREDIKEECAKCGVVKKVVIYDKHQDGVAQVWFKEAEAADACVQLLNNRWFGKRLITAETWDGKTKYKVQETKEEEEARLKKWESFLNSGKDGEKTDQDGKSVSNNVSETETNANDSDGTRSSAGSADETDDEDDKSGAK
ncbi:17S U2 SnRNP complex component HTATSF1 [Planococcus citri]|uniref:17S U2 SnRNP complex component HTATSF1 n=1 Tax=Planococcus citri TaxID=170843 RepID=UPI0031F72E2D